MTQNLGVEYVVGGMESVNNQRTNGLQLHPSQKNWFFACKASSSCKSGFCPKRLSLHPQYQSQCLFWKCFLITSWDWFSPLSPPFITVEQITFHLWIMKMTFLNCYLLNLNVAVDVLKAYCWPQKRTSSVKRDFWCPKCSYGRGGGGHRFRTKFWKNLGSFECLP